MRKERIKNGLMLFAFFFKIGCFTFGGGWSILAQMEQELVDKRKLITKEELLDMVAVGKSVPGIMITNISMLFGYYVGGWFGGVCAVLGMTCPAVLILSFVTAFYKVLNSNVWCYAALRGIRCAVVPIMGSAALSLGKEAFRRKSAIPICALALALCVFTDISNVVMIVAGVILALSIRAVKKTRGGQTHDLSQTFYSVYENRIYQLWRNVDDPGYYAGDEGQSLDDGGGSD